MARVATLRSAEQTSPSFRRSASRRFAKLDAAGTSDVGLVRSANDDSFLIAHLGMQLRMGDTNLPSTFRPKTRAIPCATVSLVAEGLGASTGAQALATNTLIRDLASLAPRASEPAAVGEALTAAIQRWRAALDLEPSFALALVSPRRFYMAHVGACCAYLLRRGRLARLDRDPSGLTSSELLRGDSLLSCTDGLTNHLPDVRIARILSDATSSADAVHELVDAAITAGGKDNVTAVVTRLRHRR